MGRVWRWRFWLFVSMLISIASTADAARTLTLAGRSYGGLIDGAFLDPNVTLTNSGEAIASVGMQIVSGYVSGDVFSVSQALPAGYTTSWNSATQTFAVSQTTPIAKMQNGVLNILSMNPGVHFGLTEYLIFTNLYRLELIGMRQKRRPLRDRIMVARGIWPPLRPRRNSPSYLGRRQGTQDG